MEYLIFGSIAAIVVFLLIQRSNKAKSAKQLKEIQNSWGQPKDEHFNFAYIARYAALENDPPFHRISGQTKKDIDFEELFSFIDRTTSNVGQQFLYKLLLEPSNKEANQQEEYIKLFRKDKKLREDVQSELIKLKNNGSYHIATLMGDPLLEKPKWFKYLILDVVVFGSLILLSFKFPLLIVILVAFVSLNMTIHYWNKSNTFQFISSFPQLNNLIIVSGIISNKHKEFHDDSIRNSISSLKSFQRRISLIDLKNKTGIESELAYIASYLTELIKAILLVEVISLYRIVDDLRQKKTEIQCLFSYVGEIDTAISIASLRAGTQKTCTPNLETNASALEIRNVYHPLIVDCIENSISIKDKSVLITGSNMSGKSTFLRTLIINSILAQTINTCFADEFSSPTLKQFSSLRIADDLFEGTSYYFKEVKVMASLIEQSSFKQNLFVLDEIFKGTNTIERIASAKAILSYLSQKNNIVVVSTHDIELTELLKEEYDLYHFTEDIKDNELHFDHKIKEGPLKTRNAIRILELSDYPEEITKEATAISKSLSEFKANRE